MSLRLPLRRSVFSQTPVGYHAANLPTNIADARGFDSRIILIPRGGILVSIGNFQEDLSQAMLVGVMSVGRLGVVYYIIQPAIDI